MDRRDQSGDRNTVCCSQAGFPLQQNRIKCRNVQGENLDEKNSHMQIVEYVRVTNLWTDWVQCHVTIVQMSKLVKNNYITVHPKASCARLPTLLPQVIGKHRVVNFQEMSLSKGWMAVEGKTFEKKVFKARVENALKNVNKRPRIRAWRWGRAGWLCTRLIRNTKNMTRCLLW